MKSKLFILVMLFILSSQLNYSQSKISFSIGGGYLASLNSSERLQYWNNGYSINFGIEYLTNSNFTLSASTSYQKYYYDEKLLQLTAPTVVGYRMQVNGENTEVYELSLKAKVYMSSSSFIRPLISIGTGVLAITQGNVILTSWMDGNETAKSSVTLKGSNNNYILGQYNLGAGLEIQISNNMHLLIEGSFVGCFNNGLSYFPITTSLKFGL